MAMFKHFSKYLRPYESPAILNPQKFSVVVNKLRQFFLDKDYLEVHPQSRLSILAACEDPSTLKKFDYAGVDWPLPQTGQMWLEYELLKNPDVAPGFFCVSTSYRNEPNPQPGRHEIIFPMFEFEMHGGINEMRQMQGELLEYLGYDPAKFLDKKYLDAVSEFGLADGEELTNDHEMDLCQQNQTPTVFLSDFPEYTHPFWNMKRNDNGITANKIDVIMSGHETIGSAERETDVDTMKDRFLTIVNGEHSQQLFDAFGRDRVTSELDDFLSFDFPQRSGGGIGIQRLMNSMQQENLLN